MDIGLLQSVNALGLTGFPLLDTGHLPFLCGGLWIAQTAQTDLFSNVGQSWNNFIQSGQVWALIIGFVVGYLFRGLTS
jgi:hypothetical protein